MDIASHRKILEDILKTRPDGTLIHREGQTLEFKESFNYGGLSEYYRDFAAFANNRGGYLVFGVKDKPRKRVGLNEKAKDLFENLDPETVTGHLLEDFGGRINWICDMIELDGKTFAYFYVAESQEKPIICKKDENKVLKEAEIYYRYSGRTQRILYPELDAIIRRRLTGQNRQWMEMALKFGKTGPANAAILDLEQRTLDTENQVLVVDEKLVERIKFIKEGEFDEKEGAPTLKLVGDVTAVNKVEVVKHEKVNPINEYPLSGAELAKQIHEKGGVKYNLIWDIIRVNKIKENKEYAYYNFRYKKQADEYLKTGRVAQGVPSIYKPEAVDYIIQLANKEE